MLKNGAFTYQKVAKETNSGTIAQLLSVFDEALKLLDSAYKFMLNSDRSNASTLLNKVFDIFSIMRQGIASHQADDAAVVDILKKFDAFYASVMAEVIELNIPNSDPAKIKVLMEAILSVRNTMEKKAEDEGW